MFIVAVLLCFLKNNFFYSKSFLCSNIKNNIFKIQSPLFRWQIDKLRSKALFYIYIYRELHRELKSRTLALVPKCVEVDQSRQHMNCVFSSRPKTIMHRWQRRYLSCNVDITITSTAIRRSEAISENHLANLYLKKKMPTVNFNKGKSIPRGP